MTISRGSTCGLVLAAAGLFAASPPGVPAGFPHADESLHYTVNWPSGLSLGDASLHSRRSGERWEFEFSLGRRRARLCRARPLSLRRFGRVLFPGIR